MRCVFLSGLFVSFFLFLSGCERMRGAQTEISVTRVPSGAAAPSPLPPSPPPTPTPSPPGQAPETLEPTPTPPARSAEATAPHKPEETEEKKAEEKKAAPSPAPAALVAERFPLVWNPGDELRNLRASLDALRSDLKLEKEPVDLKAVQDRLWLLIEWFSEVQTRWSALGIWRTAERLRSLSRSSVPDIRLANFYLDELLNICPKDKALEELVKKAKGLINKNQWSDAVAVLDKEAQAMQVSEIGLELKNIGSSLFATLRALSDKKFGVARAEIEEAMEAIDRLLSGIS